MKKLFAILLIFVGASEVNAQFSGGTLQATGLTCAMCSNAINIELKGLAFIESVRSDIKNSSFNIVFKEGSNQDIDALKLAVEDAGFSIGSLKLHTQLAEVKVGQDTHVKIGNDQFHFLEVKDQVLTGKVTLTVVDKDYTSSKIFKKLTAGTKKACVQTGQAASCCLEGKGRIYHVTI